MILSVGASRRVVRIGAAVVLGAAIWVTSGQATGAAAVALISAGFVEACAALLRAFPVAGGWLATVMAQGTAAVIAGHWLVNQPFAKGFLLGTPYPALFVVSAFWLPSAAARDPEPGESRTASAEPRAPALPLVVTSTATFITMMLQAYALLPFGGLSGFLLEKDFSVPSGRRHGVTLAASAMLGMIANELSYRLSL
jgi:hypothetical protein